MKFIFSQSTLLSDSALESPCIGFTDTLICKTYGSFTANKVVRELATRSTADQSQSMTRTWSVVNRHNVGLSFLGMTSILWSITCS